LQRKSFQAYPENNLPVYPGPGGKLYGFTSSALNVIVVSMIGHTMIQQQLPVSAGINSYSIDASALPKGMYVIHAAGRSIQFMKL
jgi:hypothetical protein